MLILHNLPGLFPPIRLRLSKEEISNGSKKNPWLNLFQTAVSLVKKGDVKVVPTQFGIHVIQITDQSSPVKRVQVGILERKVTASVATDQLYYSKANEFAGINNTAEKFNKAVSEQNLLAYVRPASGLLPMDRVIAGLENPRPLIKWAYGADKDEISPVFKLNDRYVVGIVDKIREEGFASIDDVKAEIEVEIRKEKKSEKLAADLKSKATDGKSLETIAAELNLPVKTAIGVRTTYPSLPEVGSEPNVVASALGLEKNAISKPVVGNSGVFLLSVTNMSKAAEPTQDELDREKFYSDRNYSSRVNYAAFEALKSLSKIKDNRREFY